jgi:GNAT superfamily N-acetyltransferase
MAIAHRGALRIVRGQRLFIRSIDGQDHEQVRAFFATHGHTGPVPTDGLLGKLVGDVVAVVATQLTDDGVRIDDLFVAPDLRRKRVGRFMIDELARIAANMQREWLIVEDAGPAAEFWQRVGFTPREQRWQRRTR